MKKWFELADKWYSKKGFVKFGEGVAKRNWQEFVKELKQMWNIKTEKIPWYKLDYDKTKRQLLGIYDKTTGKWFLFEDCFTVDLMTEEQIKEYKRITGGMYERK